MEQKSTGVEQSIDKGKKKLAKRCGWINKIRVKGKKEQKEKDRETQKWKGREKKETKIKQLLKNV